MIPLLSLSKKCLAVSFLWGRCLLKKAPPPNPHRENLNNWAYIQLYICTPRFYLCKIAIATEARRFTRVPFPSSGFACTNFFVF